MMNKTERAAMTALALRVARQKRQLRIALGVLDDIGHGYCCESCEPDSPRCPVGQAKQALERIKEVSNV